MPRALLLALALLPAAALAGESDVSNKTGAESETDIAIDPTNPAHLLGGSNNISTSSGAQDVYESTNGGQTWSVGSIPIPSGGSVAFESDPAVTFDRAGNEYYAFIGVDSTASQLTLWVSQKPANGSAWGAPVPVPAVTSDKEFITADRDPASACVDSIYVAWDNNETAGQTIRVSRSTNGGASFSQPPQVNTTGTTNIGAYPVVGLNGHLLVAWANFDSSSIHFSKSTDCGATWSPEKTVHTWTLPVTGIQYKPPSDPKRGISTFPWMAVDTSAGPHRGRLYVVYNDQGATGSGVDAFLTYSDDEGTTWSNPVVLNDDTPGMGNDQFFPRVAVDPADSSVHMVFYDTRNDPAHLKADVYHAKSNDGAQTWLPNERLTTQMSDETQTGSDANGYGDYIGMAASAGFVHPLWTEDPSGTNEDIYTITVVDQLAIATTTLPNGLVGTAYTGMLQAGGGKPGYTWSQTGLPATLSLNASSGAITGTPTAADLGAHALNVTVKDANNATATKAITLTVTYPPPIIGTVTLADAYAGNPYSALIAVSGGTPPYAFTATGLPASLPIGPSTGVISGTAQSGDVGGYTVNVTVTDAHNTPANAAYSLTVRATSVQIAPATLPNGQEGVVYPGHTFTASGGTIPYFWAWDVGYTPPSGLLLGSDGTLSGTPALGTAGTPQLRVSATDANSQTAVASFSLSIFGSAIANAGPNQTVDPGTQAKLDGTASSDPGGRPLTFLWTPPAGITLSDPTSATPTTSAIQKPGGYTFSLTVATPGGGPSAPATMVVTVRDPAPQAVIAGPDTATVGTTVKLDASGSKSLDGDTLTFSWSQVSGPDSSFTFQIGPQAQFVATAVGSYQISLKVSDGSNTSTATKTIKVTDKGCGCGSTGIGSELFGALLAVLAFALRRRASNSPV